MAAHLAAPRKMILIDPELEPQPASSLQTAIAPFGLRRGRAPWAERIPTKQTLERFLSQARTAVRLRGQVTVFLTTDAAIRGLNRRFRSKNKPTDVLSFPAANLLRTSRPAERVIGDIAISAETARRQAVGQGHALTCELKVLILHGLLHLAGYDHETDGGEMARQEQRLRARLGLPVGQIERTIRSLKKTAADPSTPLRSAQDERKGIAGGDKCRGGAGRPILSRSVRKGGKAQTVAVPSSRRRSP